MASVLFTLLPIVMTAFCSQLPSPLRLFWYHSMTSEPSLLEPIMTVEQCYNGMFLDTDSTKYAMNFLAKSLPQNYEWTDALNEYIEVEVWCRRNLYKLEDSCTYTGLLGYINFETNVVKLFKNVADADVPEAHVMLCKRASCMAKFLQLIVPMMRSFSPSFCNQAHRQLIEFSNTLIATKFNLYDRQFIEPTKIIVNKGSFVWKPIISDEFIKSRIEQICRTPFSSNQFTVSLIEKFSSESLKLMQWFAVLVGINRRKLLEYKTLLDLKNFEPQALAMMTDKWKQEIAHYMNLNQHGCEHTCQKRLLHHHFVANASLVAKKRPPPSNIFNFLHSSDPRMLLSKIRVEPAVVLMPMDGILNTLKERGRLHDWMSVMVISSLCASMLDVLHSIYSKDLKSHFESRTRLFHQFNPQPTLCKSPIYNRLYLSDLNVIIANEIHRQALLTTQDLHVIIEKPAKSSLPTDHLQTRCSELVAIKLGMKREHTVAYKTSASYLLRQFKLSKSWEFANEDVDQSTVYYFLIYV